MFLSTGSGNLFSIIKNKSGGKAQKLFVEKYEIWYEQERDTLK